MVIINALPPLLSSLVVEIPYLTVTTDNHSKLNSKFQEGFQIWTEIDQSEISHDQPNLLSRDIKISDPSPKTPYSKESLESSTVVISPREQ